MMEKTGCGRGISSTTPAWMTEEGSVLPERLQQKSSTYLMDAPDEAEGNYSDSDERQPSRANSTSHNNLTSTHMSEEKKSRTKYEIDLEEPSNKRPRHEINQTEKNQSTSKSQNLNSNEFICSKSDTGKEVFKRVKHRTPILQKSLAVVLASLQGVQVVIELKNDVEVTGTIEETDSNMNLTLNQVKQVSGSGEVTHQEFYFLSGSNIRYVRIPQEYPIVKQMALYMKTTDRNSVRGPRRIVDRKRKDDDIPDV
mmetsp:Transcript_733/g.844  ORF Transcript_733/g.844 Transcript_733/m.844 type:complete len:254 (-) Transcript_733:344-1105(-)